jgi:hypothetical protein
MDLPRYADAQLPPGCRRDDLSRVAGRIDDLPPHQLWPLLSRRQQSILYRRFFHNQWASLATLLDEDEPDAGAAIVSQWITWRNSAVEKMAVAGRIREPS